MNLIERIIEDKIKKYGIWLLALVILFSITFLSWFKSLNLYDFPFGIPGVFSGIILFIVLIFSIIIFLWLWEWIKEKILLPTRAIFKNKINSIPRISKWIFQGSLKIVGNSLEITASDSGCLIKDYLYKNFIISFNLKILNGGRAGIVFRAQDLENYLMLQIELQDGFKFPDGTVGTRIYDIIPHIRFLGNWETFNIAPEPYHPTSLKYISEKGLLINLEVKDCRAILTIKSNNEGEEFQWDIPTHTESNILRHQIEKSEEKIDALEGKFIPKIWFRNKYGRIGFRAYAWEKARISDLKIEKI